MEDSAPLTLLVLAAGYLFTNSFLYTSYRAARSRGYRLLFESACWGIGLLVFSQIMLTIWAQWRPESFSRGREVWLAFAPVPWLAPLFGAFLLAMVVPHLLNRVYPQERASRRAIERHGTETEKLLYRSLNSLLPISVSLKNDKVYIGWAVWTPELKSEMREIRLLPAMSGYRSPVYKSLQITTRYFQAYREIEAGRLDLRAQDFEIVIPLDELRSANLFSLEVDQQIFTLEHESALGRS